MTTQEIVSKLWNLCYVLWDDGTTYLDYLNELTYILFLKMCSEIPDGEEQIPEKYRWAELVKRDGIALKDFYKELLDYLGTKTSGRVLEIYAGSQTSIDEPKNLEKIIKSIDALDWFSAKEEGLGDLYEGLLEKIATEKKSGAGQYFTPRVLIDVITELVKPQLGEKCNDPACGTFGFMISAHKYVLDHNDNLIHCTTEQQDFEDIQAFTGTELVHDTHRLALMNAYLHDINGKITLGDTLSSIGMEMKDYDVVLTNPPYGIRKSGKRAFRTDITYATSNKQLCFLQHIYRSLKTNGKARAAVVLPDNVLFGSGDSEKVRIDLMNKCNLDTILRLPTGIFYAQGVKTSVLFFTRGETDIDNTKQVWFYDLRTNMPSFGKTNQLKKEHFSDFIKAYEAADRSSIKDERWTCVSREQIAAKGNELTFGLIQDENNIVPEDLPEPIVSAQNCLSQLEIATDLIKEVVRELQKTEK